MIGNILDKTYVPRLGENVDTDDDSDEQSEYAGFFCLRLNPTVCSCGHIQEYFEPLAYHVVIVWKEKDEASLLKIASQALKNGQDPHVVQFEETFGEPIEFMDAYKCGMFDAA